MPWGVAAAAIAAGGAIYSANKQSRAAKDAARAQQDAANGANATELQIFNQQRQDQAPFRQAGLVGLNQYMNMLGLGTGGGGVQAYGSNGGVMPTQWFGQGDVPTPNPELYGSDPLYKKAWDEVQDYHLKKDGVGYSVGSGKDALAAHMASVYARLQKQQPHGQQTATGGGKTPAQLQKDAFAMFRSAPGYQFGLDEGNKSVQASAAARGGLNSGATLKALLKFGQNYADQQGYTPYMNRLAALSGMSQTATNQLGQAGQNYAGQVGANTINAGQARAGGIYGSANAWSNAGQQLAGIAGNYLGYMKSKNDFGGV